MIYLDYNATTPLCDPAREAMLPYFSQHFGNPSSIHGAGRNARAAVDNARDKIAALIHAKPNEIIFTSGGTESCNLAVLGLVRDDVTTAVHLASRESEHRQIASFCPAAGENDFVRLGVKQRGDFVARVVDRRARVPSGSVDTRWITEMLTEVRQHRFSGSFAKRGSRVVIQINHFGLNRNPLDRMSQKVLE